MKSKKFKLVAKKTLCNLFAEEVYFVPLVIRNKEAMCKRADIIEVLHLYNADSSHKFKITYIINNVVNYLVNFIDRVRFFIAWFNSSFLEKRDVVRLNNKSHVKHSRNNRLIDGSFKFNCGSGGSDTREKEEINFCLLSPTLNAFWFAFDCKHFFYFSHRTKRNSILLCLCQIIKSVKSALSVC